MANASPVLSLEVSQIATAVQHHLRYTLGRRVETATPYEMFRALTLAIRPRLIDGLIATADRYERHDAKRLYYLSMEFLIGQSLRNNLMNLGIFDICRDAIAATGGDVEEMIAAEPDAALGNGGLGRLAACFLESLATLGMAAYGYGINYDYGLFKQEIENGFQREEPDSWLNEESPWIVHRPDQSCIVPVYGHVEHGFDRNGNYNPMWLDWKVLVGRSPRYSHCGPRRRHHQYSAALFRPRLAEFRHPHLQPGRLPARSRRKDRVRKSLQDSLPVRLRCVAAANCASCRSTSWWLAPSAICSAGTWSSTPMSPTLPTRSPCR